MLESYSVARLAIGALMLPLSATALATAQTPISTTIPKVPDGTLTLPPGPPVSDWQPRGRAPIGGTIVITGQNFRPADFQAAIGPAHFRLPVRLATSTASRIELDVPESALG